MLQNKTNKLFLQNFSPQLNSTNFAKSSKTAVFQNNFALHFKLNALSSRISQEQTHSKLIATF